VHLIEAFRSYARYNKSANRRLYEACALLDERELKRSRPAYFKSIHGALNHILVGDRIWLARFEGHEVASTGLDAILYEDFASLWKARADEDRRIESFVERLDSVFLSRDITYVNNEGRLHADGVALLLMHFFNHQTHHRGQVHDMLSQTAVPPPSLDLHRVLRPEPLH